jgi:hypothetical protein
MSFLVPAVLQQTAPQPKDSSVYLEQRAGLRVAALQFSGFPHDLDYTVHAAELYGLATEAGIQVNVQVHIRGIQVNVQVQYISGGSNR